MISAPPTVQTGMVTPGGGAGMTACSRATPAIVAAVQITTASAPHFVLPRQNSAATSRGSSDAKPEEAYCTARPKMPGGTLSAMT